MSRGMLHHESHLVDQEILEPVRWTVQDLHAAETALAVYLFVWITIFIVPKKNGQGRLIGDARPINVLQRPPGNMGLPRIHEVIRRILQSEVASKADGISYFYQFVIHEGIRPYFKVRLAGQRGEVKEYWFIRLPMGWKYSPRIAQQVSNFIVNGCGVAWLDDFIICGSRADFDNARATFLDRLKTYNVAVDNTELTPVDRFQALGLDFDLRPDTKGYRIDPSWIAKRNPDLQTFMSRLQQNTTVTFRQIYEVFGALIWASHVTARPLWMHPEAMAALSSVANDCHQNYDAEAVFPAYAIKDLDAWTKVVLQNDWCSAPKTCPDTFTHYAFSDASSTAGAFLEVVGDSVTRAEAWQRADTEHIFLAELEACIAAGPSVPTPQDHRLRVVDNSALHFVLRRGLSSNYTANKRCRQAFGAYRPWSCWIPTELMPADGMTRGEAPMPCPRRLNDKERTAVRYIHHDAFGDPRNRSESANRA
jgi:hypothetical protein